MFGKNRAPKPDIDANLIYELLDKHVCAERAVSFYKDTPKGFCEWVVSRSGDDAFLIVCKDHADGKRYIVQRHAVIEQQNGKVDQILASNSKVMILMVLRQSISY